MDTMAVQNVHCFLLRCFTDELVALVNTKIPLLSEKCPFRIFSERELTFTFAICYRRPSVCLFVGLSVTLVCPTQPVEIFGNFSLQFGPLPIH